MYYTDEELTKQLQVMENFLGDTFPRCPEWLRHEIACRKQYYFISSSLSEVRSAAMQLTRYGVYYKFGRENGRRRIIYTIQVQVPISALFKAPTERSRTLLDDNSKLAIPGSTGLSRHTN